MPFALMIVGLVLLVSAIRGTQQDLFKLVKGDFTGPNNFIFWMAAILAIGAMGYIPRVKPISTAFLVLVVLVLVLARGNPQGVGGGLFTKLTTGLKSTVTPDTQPSTVAAISPLTNVLPNLDWSNAAIN
jgi:hypothetical protein